MLWEALPKVDDGSPSSIAMSNRLAVLVAPFVFLGLGYFVFIKFAYEEKQHVEPLHVPDEVSVVPSVPGGHEGDSPIDEEGSRETVPVAASVFPDVHITEFPGRRLVVSGRMSNVVGRTKVLEAIANDLGESFVILVPTVAMVREPSSAMPTTKPPEPMARAHVGTSGVDAMVPSFAA